MAVTESSGNGYALYNGVKLPNIESVWDKETYPYAYLFCNDASDIEQGAYTAELCVSKERVAIGEVTAGTMRFSGDYGTGMTTNSKTIADMMPEYGMTIGVNTWDFGYVSDTWTEPGLPIWSNHDILNTDGTTYLTASDPIPLDGMTVIEWDGVTDGLESVPIGSATYYVVGDFLDIGSGVAVVQHPTLNEPYRVITNLADTDAGWNLSTYVYGVDGYGIGFYGNTLSSGSEEWFSYISLFAYTPASTEDTETPSDPIDPTSMLMGWLVGTAIHRMRGMQQPEEEKTLIYEENGILYINNAPVSVIQDSETNKNILEVL